ncbi:J domain-containing protein [Endozoicomonas lisbonensis]|uniref:J domain-containing protein n=1 Tax=Endozoicomonas lisbonensis TaxID=3120522 RepID=A0ABV2SB04_9GAMM
MRNPQKQMIKSGALFYLCLILLAFPKPALPDTVSRYKNRWIQYIEPAMAGVYFLSQYLKLPDNNVDLSSSNLSGWPTPEDEHSVDTPGEKARAMMDKYLPSFDVLIDIDNGYIVIIIVETDESGKPVKMHKIKTGLHYLASESLEQLKSQTALKSAQITARYAQLLKLTRESERLSPEGNKHLKQLSELNFLPLTFQTDSALPPLSAHFENDLAQPPIAQESVQQDGSTTQIPEHNNEVTRNQLIRLVNLLDEIFYTGFITEHISSEERFQPLLQVLPDRFTELLNNSSDTLLVLPGEQLRDFLRMAAAVASSDYDISQTAGLTYYFDLLMQVFYEGAFEPIEGAKYVTSREELFKRLLDLKQISWQTAREPDPELRGWGESAEVMSLLTESAAVTCGYQPVSSPYEPEPVPAVENGHASNREPLQNLRNIFIPAYREINWESQSFCIELSDFRLGDLERSLSILSDLSSGFYRSIDGCLLHVNRDSDDAVYSLHMRAGVVFNFSSPDQLLAHYQKNYGLSISLYPLLYSPVYLNGIVLTTTESEALKLFGLSLQQLYQPNAKKTIKQKYYKKAKLCHPDKHGTKRAFQALESAKETLFALVETIERMESPEE